MNTLADFRVGRKYKAKHGDGGSGRNCTGKSGTDLEIVVPVGTYVYDDDTDELIGDITEHDQRLLVAQGGQGGLGNVRFKSSVNRAPKKTTPGTAGEKRKLRFELKVRAFVMADIPGLIEGAADGAGLGIQFLKHLERTRLLLHVIDLAPLNEDTDIAGEALALVNELTKFSDELIDKERWFVFNKHDLLDEDLFNKRAQAILEKFEGEHRVFHISALAKQGLEPLKYAIMDYMDGEGEEDL